MVEGKKKKLIEHVPPDANSPVQHAEPKRSVARSQLTHCVPASSARRLSVSLCTTDKQTKLLGNIFGVTYAICVKNLAVAW